MKVLIGVAMVLMFTGCVSQSEQAQSLLDRIEFQEGQTGCMRATGQISIGGNPFAQSSLNVSVAKKQGDDAPDC